MRPSAALSTAVVFATCVLAASVAAAPDVNAQNGGSDAAVAAAHVKRVAKIGKIPRDLAGYHKRADDGETTDNKDSKTNDSGGDDEKPSPTPTKDAPASKSTDTSEKSTPTSHKDSNSTKGSSDKATSDTHEQGNLESDSEDKSAKDNGGDKNGNSDNESDGGDNGDAESGNESDPNVVEDENGNPIVTNANASYWAMITPTGINYLSSASTAGVHAVAVAAIVCVGALF